MSAIIDRAKAIEDAAAVRLDAVFSDPDGNVRHSGTGRLVTEEELLLLNLELSALTEMAAEATAEMQMLNNVLTEALRRSSS